MTGRKHQPILINQQGINIPTTIALPMAKAGKGRRDGCGCGSGVDAGRCRVDSMASVDARGQMVLRKELRARAQIKPGDHLAVVTWERKGKVCCISLIRVGELDDLVKEKLGPMMKAVMDKGKGGKKA
jgi:bifunctional DNA-binding transcriptional regulator/antitoxin component of YhaV-PrlF toxin-antitoxin module